MEKINLNPSRTHHNICESDRAYWLKTAGEPNFETLEDLTNALLANAWVPNWARTSPVLGYADGGTVFGDPHILWYTGVSYLGGDNNNTRYYRFHGHDFGGTEMVPNPLYWELGEPKNLNLVYSWPCPDKESVSDGDPRGEQVKPLTFGDGKAFAEANALTQFHVYGRVTEDLKVAPRSVSALRDPWQTPQEFRGRPIFWSFYVVDGEEMSPKSGSEVQRLLDLGILRKVSIPKQDQRYPGLVGYAVGPRGINKIVILEPLGIVVLRDHNFRWWQVDLVSGAQGRMTPSVRKVLKSLNGGPTRYQVWRRAKGQRDERVLLVEVGKGKVPRAWLTDYPEHWRRDYRCDEGTLTHRQAAKLLRERGGKSTLLEFI